MIESFQQDADHLETFSRTDALTGLGNRRAFDEQLGRETMPQLLLVPPMPASSRQNAGTQSGATGLTEE